MSATEKGNETVQGDCVDAEPYSGPTAGGPSLSPQLAPSKVTGDSSSDKYRYNMNYTSIGQCVIINNENFDPNTGLSTRHGTDKDEDLVTTTFKGLGYEIKLFKDLTTAKILEVLTEVSQRDHSKMASFVCVLLSHGVENMLYGTDGAVELNELTGLFRGDRCATLVGKPKLFFIQACRGTELDSGIETDSIAFEDNESPTRIPVEADFLYAYSTTPGYFAWRNQQSGSWFIRSLCSILDKHGKQLEIMQLLTRVNNMVARDFQSSNDNPEWDAKKQMPSIVSMLTKELYFPK